MEQTVRVYQTSIGKKIMMAVAGLVIAIWLVLHMWGNLHFFEGPTAFNHYAEFLRAVGSPLFADRQLLWLMRLVLLAALLVHVVAFAQLYVRTRAARRHRYRTFDPQVFSRASRTMKWGGIAILLFVAYHLLHMTWGTAHRDFIPGDAYHNVLVGFQSVPVTVIYLGGLAALGLHLYHGTWSAFQTLGISSGRINRWRRPFALVFALVVTVGFAAVPLAIVAGLVG